MSLPAFWLLTLSSARVCSACVSVRTLPAGRLGTLWLLTKAHRPSGPRSAAEAVAFCLLVHVLLPAGQYEVKRVCPWRTRHNHGLNAN